MSRGKLLTLPNIISLSRLALALAFVLMPARDVRIALVVVASITDYLDGWVARKRRSFSRSGALIDPIADRVFVLAAISAFLFNGDIGTGQYFVLLSRDLATAVGFLVARAITWLRPVAFKARPAGKVVTTLQLATLIVILLYPRAAEGFIAAVGVASAYAIGDYTLALWRARMTA